MNSTQRYKLRFAIAGLLLVTAAVSWLLAHEGHAPLPTKGAQVDVEKGRIVLASASRSALDVDVGNVEIRPFGEKILAYVAFVAPWQKHAYATSQLAGKIAQLHARPGQTVAAGQVLAEVQSSALENLRLEIVAAQNSLGLSQKMVETLRLTPATVSGQTLQEAETRYQQDRNALEVARSKWFNLGMGAKDLETLLQEGKLSRPVTLPVLSPIDGIVIHADLTVGRVIEPTEHFFEIVNLEKVWARIDVLEKDMHKVEVGQPVELTLAAYPGEPFSTTILVQGLALDPVTHLVSYWGELSNPPGKEPRFLPGMKGQAFIVVDQTETAKVLPAGALIEDGLDHYVLVEEANSPRASEYQKKNVVVVRRDQEWVEFQSGDIFPGDRVVTRGAHELGSFFIPEVLRMSPQGAKTIGLKVESVQEQVVEDVLEVDGGVEVPPARQSFAASQIDGTLQKIHVDRGQQIAKGQLLGEVASLEFQNLQLDLLKEHLEFQMLDKQYQALRDLDQVVSRMRLLQLESNLATSRNRKGTLTSRLEILGLSQEQLDDLLHKKQLTKLVPVRATVGGTLVHFDKTLGQAVKAGEKLFTLHDLKKPWIQGYVSERDLPRVRLGQAVRFRFSSDPGSFYTGKIVQSGRVLDMDSRTLSIWVELNEAPKKPLLHKQLARLSITVSKTGPILAAPISAVVQEGINSFVFIQKPDGLFERQEVKTGRSDDRFVEILRGLEAGQQVAVQGSADLQTADASLR